jgi:hypothetical protein
MLPVQKVGVGTVKARASQSAYVPRGLDCSPSSDVDTIPHTTRPFWVVELFANAGFFNQKRCDAAQLAVGKAFVEVLGDDGSSLDWGGLHVAPAYLKNLYCLMLEIPEGSWGAAGRTVSALEIAAIAGTSKNAGDTRNCRKTQQSLRRHASHEVVALKTYVDRPLSLPEVTKHSPIR